MKDYIESKFEYNLCQKLDEIREKYTFHEACQKSLLGAIIAFLEGDSFEDVVKNAISIGSDSDTIACIAGGLAETIYEIPLNLRMNAAHNIFEFFPILNHRDVYFYDNVINRKKAVNQISFIWFGATVHFPSAGRDISEINEKNGYGTELYKTISADLNVIIPKSNRFFY